MTVSVEQQVEQVASALDAAGLFFGHGTDNAFDEAAWLVLEACELDPSGDAIPWDQPLTVDQQASVQALLGRRIESGEPLAYLVNRAWFAGHDFFIDHRAIVPRSHIGEWIPDRFVPWRTDRPAASVLDLCTGSGCIAVALALAFPEAKVGGVDISREALAVAQINAVRQNVTGRVNFIEADVFPVGGIYDLIVSNPPYVPDDVVSGLPYEYRAEPKIALAGGAEGLDILDKILNGARRYLRADGILVVEVGSSRELVEKRYPHLELMWIESEDALAGVFVVDRVSLPSVR